MQTKLSVILVVLIMSLVLWAQKTMLNYTFQIKSLRPKCHILSPCWIQCCGISEL